MLSGRPPFHGGCGKKCGWEREDCEECQVRLFSIILVVHSPSAVYLLEKKSEIATTTFKERYPCKSVVRSTKSTVSLCRNGIISRKELLSLFHSCWSTMSRRDWQLSKFSCTLGSVRLVTWYAPPIISVLSFSQQAAPETPLATPGLLRRCVTISSLSFFFSSLSCQKHKHTGRVVTLRCYLPPLQSQTLHRGGKAFHTLSTWKFWPCSRRTTPQSTATGNNGRL